MRFLGIDYGAKRIGVAISDEEGVLAFPKEILVNDSSLLEKIRDMLKTENASEVVIGESIDFSGKENKIMDEIRKFVAELETKFHIPVHLEKEFMTSIEARRHKNFQEQGRRLKKDNSKIDSSAAALILQRYLDKKNQAVNFN